MADKTNCLVVDDELAVLESLKMILEVKEYAVKTAMNLEDAASAVQKDKFDIAFIDLRFNGRDIGLDILAKIKELSPSTECCIVTGYASEKSKVRAVELGAMEYVSKPFMMEVIYDLVNRALERKRK
ncbi:MAG: response regulator [Candidatus Margulisiibacteriota bacterium]|nr:response regulator [Candidatus Margulisiibacteriota bacterium]